MRPAGRADLSGVEKQRGAVSKPTWDSRENADPTENTGRLNELKRDIALNRYDVDADAVADAILSKLQLVKQRSPGARRERS